MATKKTVVKSAGKQASKAATQKTPAKKVTAKKTSAKKVATKEDAGLPR